MYKKAVKHKITGACIAIVITLLFTVVVIKFTEDVALYLLGGFLAVFFIVLVTSIIRYITKLGKIKAEYGDELESDVDSCQKSVSGKYFFFDDCMIDLSEGRMIFYSEIKKISGILTKEVWNQRTDYHRRSGAVVELTMDDGKVHLFSGFNSGFSNNSKETEDGYKQFCIYLSEYAPHAIADSNKTTNI